jgi:hypothetical protein
MLIAVLLLDLETTPDKVQETCPSFTGDTAR